MAEEEAKFVYDGNTGIFIPIYKTYKSIFFQNIIDHTKIKTDYAKFNNTAIYERYMLNAAQFSAAKNSAETKMMQGLVFKDNKRQSFSVFRSDAKGITDIVNDTWLRVEYDTSVRQVVAGQQFNRYRDDSDIYPYWRYLHTISQNPRDEHLLLVGKIFRIGDYEGDMCFPPNGFNCGCGSEQLSDLNGEELADGKASLQDVDPQFRFNPADQGILPKEGHTYFEALKSANESNGKLFGITGNKAPSTKLAAKGLHNMVYLMDKWKHKFHSDHNTITFQNEDTLTNVIFNMAAFHTIQRHSAGFEQLPGAIENGEIWSYWGDEKQLISMRNYIKDNYVVQTKDGIITDAFVVDNVNKYRRGVIL